jgi:hypothetical protein
MRFMLLMIPHGYESAEPDVMPEPAAIKEMMRFNESLKAAGVLLAVEGLHPPSVGARVYFDGDKPRVVPGPFPGVQEALGGFWILDVKSKEEAIQWASRCPASGNEVIEVREIQELDDFPAEIKQAIGDWKT